MSVWPPPLTEVGSKIRVRKYGVELPGFEELICSELQRPGSKVDLLLVDEVGKMECFSTVFVEQMETLLDGPIPILATVAIFDAQAIFLNVTSAVDFPGSALAYREKTRINHMIPVSTTLIRMHVTTGK